MGQDSSIPAQEKAALSTEQLSRNLATRFYRKCFTGVEYYSFKQNFHRLAERSNDGVEYWSEDTFTRFLSIPDALKVGPILFQSASYIGAFPFMELAPAVLDHDALVKIIAIFTGKYTKAIKPINPIKLIFRSFAVINKLDGIGAGAAGGDGIIRGKEKAENEDDEDDDSDDELTMAALDSLDALDVFRHGEKPKLQAYVPAETMKRIIMLALLVSPLEPQQPLATFVGRCTGDALDELEEVAGHVLSAFKITEGKGILYQDFKRTMVNSTPHLLSGFSALFEHFLFSPDLDASTTTEELSHETTEALLPTSGEILDIDLLSQLSLFIPGKSLWRRVRRLFAGSEAGYSMGALEKGAIGWQGPTLLLISGSRVQEPPDTPRERSFYDTLPPRRAAHGGGGSSDSEVIFGVYLDTPWRLCFKDCFGSPNALLFQLAPTHEVFTASRATGSYVYFNRSTPLTVGCEPPPQTASRGYTHTMLPVAPVSLTLDNSLEFAVFNHSGNPGGAFRSDGSQRRDRADWQERFAIDEVELWGCGGDEEDEAQKRHWAWEEREAALRRKINIRSGDIEADRALLEMAGLIGANRSGGSMG